MNKDIGVIFDFNGTCIFDSKYHNMAWKEYVEELTLQSVSDIDVEEWIIDKTPKDILEHFLGYELSDNMIQQFSEEKERLYRSMIIKDDLQLAPGLKDFLNYLLLAQIRRTIATSADLGNVNLYFERYNLELYFKWEDVVIGAGNMPVKPDPHIYIAAMNKLELPPGKIVAFEDSKSGIKAAYDAGIRHIIVVTGDNNDSELVTMPGVYASIRDFTELSSDNF